MTNEDLQALLTAMLQSGEGVSDCLFINGKPPLVERYGKLHELPHGGAGHDPAADPHRRDGLAPYRRERTA